MFKLEIKDDTQALTTENLNCPITIIIYRVEEFRTQISVQQCWNYQSFGHSAKTCGSKAKCLICGESNHHKGCPKKRKNNQNVLIVRDLNGHICHDFISFSAENVKVLSWGCGAVQFWRRIEAYDF